MCLLFTSAAYIQVLLKQDFIREANNINHVGSGLIWVHIVYKIGYLRTKADGRADDKSRGWWEKG